MADDDYRRLAAACFCGAASRPRIPGSRGQDPKNCERHSPTKRIDRTPRSCAVCTKLYAPSKEVQKFCSQRCRYKQDNKPLRPLRRIPCTHCGAEFDQQDHRSMYCGKNCKRRAWDLRSGYKRGATKKTPRNWWRYFTGQCACGQAWGARQPRSRCQDCQSQLQAQAVRDAGRALEEAKHRAQALAVRCEVCAGEFCPLYGYKGRSACPLCLPAWKRRRRRVAKLRRKARLRGAEAESVDPLNVFARDRWRCQLCGVKTPSKKRGTCEPDAPELDHILPLSKGGEHSYLNTQCACRKCNGRKSDRPLGQMLLVG